MTDKDRQFLRALTARAGDLNDAIKDAHGDGYQVTVFVETTKPGYHRVRFELHRKVGPS